MNVNDNQFQLLPFPYFCIDTSLRILQTSEKAKELFVGKTSLTDLIEPINLDKCKRFLLNIHEQSTLDLPFLTNSGSYISFRIYKLANEMNNIHLFCFPNTPSPTHAKNISVMHDSQPEYEAKVEAAASGASSDKTNPDHFGSVARLASGIAHEIRNPLTTIKGFIQLLKPYLREIDKELYADVALEEINRANDIIFEFLNAIKPQKNKRREITIKKLVKDLVLLYESESILRNIQVTIADNCPDALIFVDVSQIKQVLINIFKNAIEAIETSSSSSSGMIIISTEVDEKNASIIISDNGCGMSYETIDQLFLPFYSTKEVGTGIGLSVSKTIINDHGGNIEVTSALDVGTTFKVILPIMSS